ncbi:hypothetical protein V8E55_010483 [Tylopilus felleus]
MSRSVACQLQESMKTTRSCMAISTSIMDCGKDGDWAFLVIEDRGRDVGTIYKSYGHMSFYFVADLIVVTLCQSEKAESFAYAISPGYITKTRRQRVAVNTPSIPTLILDVDVVDDESEHEPDHLCQNTDESVSTHEPLRRFRESARNILECKSRAVVVLVTGVVPVHGGSISLWYNIAQAQVLPPTLRSHPLFSRNLLREGTLEINFMIPLVPEISSPDTGGISVIFLALNVITSLGTSPFPPKPMVPVQFLHI